LPLRITISKENYLKAIAEAESEGETVKAVTLVRWLGVSAPAVTMAIKRLRRDLLIAVGEEGQLTLTQAGRDIANRSAARLIGVCAGVGGLVAASTSLSTVSL